MLSNYYSENRYITAEFDDLEKGKAFFNLTKKQFEEEGFLVDDWSEDDEMSTVQHIDFEGTRVLIFLDARKEIGEFPYFEFSKEN